MATIPLPALDLKTPQEPGPLDNVSKLMALRSMMTNQQSQQQELQIRQQQVKDQQATTAAMKSWDGKDPAKLAQLVLDNDGSANAATGVQQHFLQVKDTASQIAQRDSQTGETNLKTVIEKHNQYLGAINAAEQVPDDQLHQHLADVLHQLIPDGADPQSLQFKQQAMQLLQSNAPPDQVRKQLDLTKQSLQGSKEQFVQAQSEAATKKDAAQTGEANAAADQKRMESAWYQSHGGAPGVSAEVQQQAAWLARPENKGKDAADYKAWAAKQAPLATFNLQSGLLTDQAKDMAAENYFQTGQLPAGARSPAMISQIIDRAAQLHPGGNLAGNKAAYDANKKSYSDVTDTLTKLSAFESAGLKNLKQFTDLADKLPDTGIPWANTPVRLLNNKLVGDEWMPAVEAARTVALREIARVTNDPKLSGVLTDSARQEVEGLSPQNATMNQIKHVVDVLKNDMTNVHQGLSQQKQDLGRKLGIQAETEQQTQPNNTPAATGKSVSLAAAKQLPQNAGKSDAEIKADIEKYGHTVVP